MINYSGLIFETSMHVSRHSFTWRIPSEPESIDFWWLYYHFPLSISEGFLIVWLILQPHVISLYSIPKRVPRQWKAFLIATVWRKGQSRARAGKSLHVTGRIIDLETWSGKPEPGTLRKHPHQETWKIPSNMLDPDKSTQIRLTGFNTNSIFYDHPPFHSLTAI